MLGNKKSRKVFISYARKNKRYKDRLDTHFSTEQRKGVLDIWSDSDKIQAGTNWEQEIDKALTGSELAVLILSADFLSSDYIQNTELPAIMKRVRNKRMSVVPVLLSDCRWKEHPLIGDLHVIGADKPFHERTNNERERAWKDVVDQTVKAFEEIPPPVSLFQLTVKWTLFSVLGALIGFWSVINIPEILQAFDRFPPGVLSGLEPVLPGFFAGLGIGLCQTLAIYRNLKHKFLWFCCILAGWLLFYNESLMVNSLSDGAWMGGLIGALHGLLVWSYYAKKNYFWWLIALLLWTLVSAVAYVGGFWTSLHAAKVLPTWLCEVFVASCTGTLESFPVHGLMFGLIYGLISSPVLYLLINRISRRKQI